MTYNSHKDKADEIAEAISEKYNVKAVSHYCDISSEESVEDFFNKVVSDFGGVDILINNAAYWPQAFVRDMTLEEWNKCLDVNLTGHFYFFKDFYPLSSG